MNVKKNAVYKVKVTSTSVIIKTKDNTFNVVLNRNDDSPLVPFVEMTSGYSVVIVNHKNR